MSFFGKIFNEVKTGFTSVTGGLGEGIGALVGNITKPVLGQVGNAGGSIVSRIPKGLVQVGPGGGRFLRAWKRFKWRKAPGKENRSASQTKKRFHGDCAKILLGSVGGRGGVLCG